MRNQQATQLLFDLSKSGRRGTRFPDSDVPAASLDELIPRDFLADAPLPLPELAEPDVVRHFTNLSTLNMSVDTHFYPLGSCTMKHNPKRNERMASLPGFAHVHPYQSDQSIQGLLELLYNLQNILAEIAGLPGVSLQPAAGAHGRAHRADDCQGLLQSNRRKEDTRTRARQCPRHESGQCEDGGL